MYIKPNVSKVDPAEKGTANGIATLDSSGIVPSSQLPTLPQKITTITARSTETEVTLSAYSFYLVYASSAADSYTAAPSLYMIVDNNGNPVSVHLGGTDYLTITSKGSTSHKVGITSSAPFGTQVIIWKVSSIM